MSSCRSLKAWLKPIIATGEAQVLVTDDADALKTAAHENGVHPQVCKSHVLRNTEALIEQLQTSLTRSANQSLEQIGVSLQQAFFDLQRLKELIRLRQPEANPPVLPIVCAISSWIAGTSGRT